MATKKKAAKKAAPKKKQSAPKKAAPQKGKKNQREPIKVSLDGVITIRIENIAEAFANYITAAVPGDTAGGNSPNFEFKFVPTDGVKLSKIDIDGVIFRGQSLVEATKTDSDGKLVVSVYAEVMTTPIPIIIEAVGESNRAMTFTLKFSNKDIFKESDNMKILIADNGFGFLALPSVNLA